MAVVLSRTLASLPEFCKVLWRAGEAVHSRDFCTSSKGSTTEQSIAKSTASYNGSSTVKGLQNTSEALVSDEEDCARDGVKLRGIRGLPDDFDEDFFPIQLLRQPQGLLGDKRVTREQRAAAKKGLKGPGRKLTYHHILVPEEVTVENLGSRFFFSGPLGSNAIDLGTVDQAGGGAYKLRKSESGRVEEIVLAGPDKSILGTARTLLHNKINGVTKGYLVYLELKGVGYRVSKEVKDVQYNLPS